jgi:RNA polymerase sigma factor (sigma-70 family)
MAEIEPPGATERRLPGSLDQPLGQPHSADRRLAVRFAAGERAAAEEVLAQYTPRITRLVRRMLGWRSDVDDVVQDIFVTAFASRRKFRGGSRLETWLMRIAINGCRAFHRRRLLRGELFNRWRDANYDPASADLDRRAALPDDLASAAERMAAVRLAVAELPAKYREVVILYYLEETTAQESAEILGLKRNSVEVRLSRARKMLGQRLGKLIDQLP